MSQTDHYDTNIHQVVWVLHAAQKRHISVTPSHLSWMDEGREGQLVRPSILAVEWSAEDKKSIMIDQPDSFPQALNGQGVLHDMLKQHGFNHWTT